MMAPMVVITNIIMVEIHHIFCDSYKLHYCWKSVKRGKFLLFGPLLATEDAMGWAIKGQIMAKHRGPNAFLEKICSGQF